MFSKKIPYFRNFIFENLYINNWRNYKDDTDLSLDSSSKESVDVSEIVMKCFEVNDPSDLLFTSNDIAFGEDYMFFMDIIDGLSPENVRTLNMPGYITYISIFKYYEKTIVVADIVSNDNSVFSHIFIKSEDFEFFDPDKHDAVEGQEEQFEEEDESSQEESQEDDSQEDVFDEDIESEDDEDI